MNEQNKTLLLTALIGSRAHGLAREDSDYDYRGVYILPTEDILALNYKPKATQTFEDDNDNVVYEVGYFLQLATKSNPSILEIFMAPILRLNEDGDALLKVFPYVWDAKTAYNAFDGYAKSQRDKMLSGYDDKQARKSAMAYVRTYHNLYQLLKTGRFTLEIKEPKLKDLLLGIRQDGLIFHVEQAVKMAEEYKSLATKELEICKQTADIERVNKFLVKLRAKYLSQTLDRKTYIVV